MNELLSCRIYTKVNDCDYIIAREVELEISRNLCGASGV